MECQAMFPERLGLPSIKRHASVPKSERKVRYSVGPVCEEMLSEPYYKSPIDNKLEKDISDKFAGKKCRQLRIV